MTAGRLAVLVVLTAVAVGVAVVLQRRRPDPPSAPSYRAPAQLDRDDFSARPGAWAVILFGSTTCDTCPITWATVERVLQQRSPAGGVGADDGPPIGSQRIDVQTDAELHRRYRIDGVPTTVLTDPEGVVTHTFFGPMSDAELLDALGEAGL